MRLETVAARILTEEMRANAREGLWPLAFVLAPIIGFLGRNIREVDAIQALTAVVAFVAVAALVELAIVFALRSVTRGALCSSVAFALFFSYGLLLDRTPQFRVMFAGLPIGPNKALYLGIALTMVGVVVFVLRGSEHAVASAWSVVRVVAGAFMVSAVALFVYLFAVLPRADASAALPQLDGGEQATAMDSESQPPDIYYLLLDAYMGQSALEQATGYDNSPFMAELESRGFLVVDQARSNYYNTDESVLATLNMDYLTNLDAWLDDVGSEWDSEFLAKKNRVMQELRDSGYRVVIVRSPYGPLARVSDAEVLDPSSAFASEVTSGIIDMTMLAAVADSSMGPVQRQRVLKAFDYAEESIEGDSPKCVFVHVLAPHQPYVFDENGDLPANDVVYAAGGSASEREAYAAQLVHINSLTLDFLDELLATKRGRSAIVVVQGDHGPRFGGEPPWLNDSATEQDYLEYFSVLSAFRFPDGTPEGAETATTPVNTFRIVLNEALGTDYPLLPDRSFGYSTEVNGALVDTIDVTEEFLSP